MKHITSRIGLLSITAVVWLVAVVPVQAADDFVYGRELMTQQELAEHRAHMQSLHTEEERRAYQLEHHKMMQERARAQGKVLPDAPGPQGQGMGPYQGGRGPGSMRGSGRGMGPP